MTQSDDELALAVLKGIAESVEYAWNERDKPGNTLPVKIKEQRGML